MDLSNLHFRYFKASMQSIAALMPLLPSSDLTDKPCDGIMIYSFATLQSSLIFQEVRNSGRCAIFIAGGPHPSARPAETLRFFDYVVIGEGEKTLPELIDVLQKGGDISQVPGIAFKKGDKTIFTDNREDVELDNYPPFHPDIMHSSIEITRGCPFSCAYCQTPQLFGHRMRHRSIERIARHARFMRDIRFTSPNAFAYGSDGIHPRVDKVESLLQAMPHKNVFFGTFPSEVRPEFISDRFLELVSTYCANTALNMGGQSGSQRILDMINRGHTVEDIIAGVERCINHGFTPIVDLIFGLPGETEEDQLETLRLINWITGKGGKVHSHYFMPLPGTTLENAMPSALSNKIDKIMGKLALHGKTTGRWSKA